MPDKDFPYLCSGVFFLLLMEIVKKSSTARDHQNGIKEIHTAANVLSGLIWVVSPDSPEITVKSGVRSKELSDFRSCAKSGSKNIPFDKESVALTFHNNLLSDYDSVLHRMVRFCELHLDLNRKEWLIKALLDVIERDHQITASEFFYIMPGPEKFTKSEICNQSSFCFEPFLLGVLDYVLFYRRDKNEQGSTTVESWSSVSQGKERKYIGDAGNRLTRKITVQLYSEYHQSLPTPTVMTETEPVTVHTDRNEEQKQNKETGYVLIKKVPSGREGIIKDWHSRRRLQRVLVVSLLLILLAVAGAMMPSFVPNKLESSEKTDLSDVFRVRSIFNEMYVSGDYATAVTGFNSLAEVAESEADRVECTLLSAMCNSIEANKAEQQETIRAAANRALLQCNGVMELVSADSFPFMIARAIQSECYEALGYVPDDSEWMDLILSLRIYLDKEQLPVESDQEILLSLYLYQAVFDYYAEKDFCYMMLGEIYYVSDFFRYREAYLDLLNRLSDRFGTRYDDWLNEAYCNYYSSVLDQVRSWKRENAFDDVVIIAQGCRDRIAALPKGTNDADLISVRFQRVLAYIYATEAIYLNRDAAPFDYIYVVERYNEILSYLLTLPDLSDRSLEEVHKACSYCLDSGILYECNIEDYCLAETRYIHSDRYLQMSLECRAAVCYNITQTCLSVMVRYGYQDSVAALASECSDYLKQYAEKVDNYLCYVDLRELLDNYGNFIATGEPHA